MLPEKNFCNKISISGVLQAKYSVLLIQDSNQDKRR